ncbi:hypothetical protein EOD41_08535 [Mucilaginibacter limnophilus]|uniref:Addiction module protein n=1 Tax=Mucilaginibacter limnophilus TaxID=1932778 RepID=A0A3S2Y2K4_9SPHI|nr:hypothetical protein [Mucilaginibacter limnophilus]RVU01989.1 hypothetical protein EOD41_08535 [Mucilaginibacter limnophilus]
MDLQAEKIELVKLLLEVEDEQTLNEIKAVLHHDYDFYDDLPEAVKDSIEQALEDVEKGNVRSHEEVIKEMKSKYGI